MSVPESNSGSEGKEEESEDESEILEESPCGRWQKRKEQVGLSIWLLLWQWFNLWDTHIDSYRGDKKNILLFGAWFPGSWFPGSWLPDRPIVFVVTNLIILGVGWWCQSDGAFLSVLCNVAAGATDTFHSSGRQLYSAAALFFVVMDGQGPEHNHNA